MIPLELFRLFGTIALDNAKANQGIDETTDKAEKAESKMSAAFKKIGVAVTAAFAVDKIKDFSLKCIEIAANVNAMNSQFEQTFGDMQQAASDAIGRVAKDSGIIETRLKGIGTSIYAFAKTTGMESAEALGMMEEALQVAADSAAYYDRSLEDTTESLKSFLKGNYANDAALGLSCTETTRNTAANKLYGKSFMELSEAQKQMTLLQMVKDANELSGAVGQAARESDGWENVTGNLTESLKLLMATIGTPILSATVPVVKKMTEKIMALGETVRKAQEWFGKHKVAVETVTSSLKVATAAMVAFKVSAVITKVVQGFQQAQVALALYTTTTKGATIAQGVLNGTLKISEGLVALLTGKMTLAQIAQLGMAKAQAALNLAMTANPIGLVVAAIAALIATFMILWNKSEEFRNFWKDLWKKISSFVSDAVDSIKKVVKAGFDAVKEHIIDPITEAYETVKEVFEKVYDAIVEPIEKAKEKVSGIIDKIKDKLNIGTTVETVSSSNSQTARIKAHASGGILTKPTIFGYTPATKTYHLGGEAGAEAVVPIEKLQGYVSAAVSSQNEGQESLLKAILTVLQAILDKDTAVYLSGKEISKAVNKELGVVF